MNKVLTAVGVVDAVAILLFVLGIIPAEGAFIITALAAMGFLLWGLYQFAKAFEAFINFLAGN